MLEHDAVEQHGGHLKLHRDADFGEVSNAPIAIGQIAKSITSAVGTRLATKYLDLGVAAHLPHKARRGGARNSSARTSQALSADQVGNLLAAAAHATHIGRPFTRMITIHWQAAGIPLDAMSKATGRFIDLLTKALSRHGSETAWLWVHENGDGKGGHCHMLVYVPARLVPVVVRLQKRWLRSITGSPYRAKIIRSRPVGGRVGLETNNPDVHTVNLEVALGYFLKGECEAAAAKHGLTRLEPGGLVIGKRCGTSQNIGAKARKELKS